MAASMTEGVSAGTSTTSRIAAVGGEAFEAAVLEASHRVPVLVDFWAAWCGPCRMLAPVLEQVAAAYGDALKVVKLDTEAEPELARAFGILSLPSVKLFRDGEAVDGFTGAIPAGQVFAFLERHVGEPDSPARERAARDLAEGRPDDAIATLEEAAEEDPGDHRIVLDLVRAEIDAGRLEAADRRMRRLPANVQEQGTARVLRSRIHLGRVVEDAPSLAQLQAKLEKDPEDDESRYQLAVRRLLEGATESGLEGLLESMTRDRGPAREALLCAFELLGEDHDLTGTYRRRMASLLY